jgi:hypothetical protein
MSDITWGLKCEKEGFDSSTDHTWGARAIFIGGKVDLLHDRQSLTGPEEGRAEFIADVNSGPLKAAIKYAHENYWELMSSSDKFDLYWDNGIRVRGTCFGVADNYLYIGVWREELT